MVDVLMTNNETWGFWGTSVKSEWPFNDAWETAFRFLADRFDLSAEMTRDLLDSRFGRHLSDDLSFIKVRPMTAEVIAEHLGQRFSERSWVRWAREEIAGIRKANQ